MKSLLQIALFAGIVSSNIQCALCQNVIKVVTPQPRTEFHIDFGGNTYVAYDANSLNYLLNYPHRTSFDFLSNSALLNSIELTDKQRQTLAEARSSLKQRQTELDKKYRSILMDEKDPKKRVAIANSFIKDAKELHSQYREQIDEHLIGHQQTLIETFNFQKMLGNLSLTKALCRPFAAGLLDLNGEQQDELKKINRETEEEIKKQLERIKRQARQKIDKVLNREQKNKLNQLLEESTDKKKSEK